MPIPSSMFRFGAVAAAIVIPPAIAGVEVGRKTGKHGAVAVTIGPALEVGGTLAIQSAVITGLVVTGAIARRNPGPLLAALKEPAAQNYLAASMVAAASISGYTAAKKSAELLVRHF